MKSNRKVQFVLLSICMILVSSILIPLALSLSSINVNALVQNDTSRIDKSKQRRIKIDVDIRIIEYNPSNGIEVDHKEMHWNEIISKEEQKFHQVIDCGKGRILKFSFKCHVLVQTGPNKGKISLSGLFNYEKPHYWGDSEPLFHWPLLIPIGAMNPRFYELQGYESSKHRSQVEIDFYVTNSYIDEPPNVNLEILKNGVKIGADAPVSNTITVRAFVKDKEDRQPIIKLYINDVERKKVQGTSLFFNWNTNEVIDGEQWIKIETIDNAGNIVESKRKLFVDNERPIIDIIKTYRDGAYTELKSGDYVTRGAWIIVEASDNHKIDMITLYIDGVIKYRTIGPLRWKWEDGTIGQHKVEIFVIDQAENQISRYLWLQYDDVDPFVKIASPVNPNNDDPIVVSYIVTIGIHVWERGNDLLPTIELYIYGVLRIKMQTDTRNQGQLKFRWDTRQSINGQNINNKIIEIKAVATDRAGNVAIDNVKVHVKNYYK